VSIYSYSWFETKSKWIKNTPVKCIKSGVFIFSGYKQESTNVLYVRRQGRYLLPLANIISRPFLPSLGHGRRWDSIHGHDQGSFLRQYTHQERSDGDILSVMCINSIGEVSVVSHVYWLLNIQLAQYIKTCTNDDFSVHPSDSFSFGVRLPSILQMLNILFNNLLTKYIGMCYFVRDFVCFILTSLYWLCFWKT
jgi:hypothetical protein